MGPHTSTDDPKRYRSHVESEVWRSYDPISRLRAYLLLNELCDEELLGQHDTAARTAAGDAESELSGRHTRTLTICSPLPIRTLLSSYRSSGRTCGPRSLWRTSGD